MVNYIGVDTADANFLDKIGIGLAKGALQAGISISGCEVSQLGDILDGFDLVGAATGTINLQDINTGLAIGDGDAVIGLASDGIFEWINVARSALFGHAGLNPKDKKAFLDLGHSIGTELLTPTAIYVREVCEINNTIPLVGALAHITGDGLLNLLRASNKNVTFVLDKLPEPPPIFKIIQKLGDIDDATMYQVFNMGVGFCITTPPNCVDRVMGNLGPVWAQSLGDRPFVDDTGEYGAESRS